MPADWEPQEPAFQADFSEDFRVVVTYLAAQGAPAARAAFRQRAYGALREVGGAQHVEGARFTDAAGVVNDVVVAYWRRPADADAFWADSRFAAWWNEAARLHDEAGYWRESFAVPRERLETIISSLDYQVGVAKLADGVSGPIVAHGYCGAARDRLTASARDDFSGGARRLTHRNGPEATVGRRVRVFAPRNLCVIRSGQDWSECDERERRFYDGEVAPTLEAGMNFLRDEGHEIGCFTCRYMRETSTSGEMTARTFGLAYFGDLDRLETWADRHPTHLAILEKFLKLLQESNFQPGLRLWHEILIVSSGEDLCEYVNCHGRTGFLPYVNLVPGTTVASLAE